MKTLISYAIRSISYDSGAKYWSQKLFQDYKIKSICPEGIILKQIYHILKILPGSLVRDCGIDIVEISYTMGPNKPFYPNHGYFVGNKIVLNADIFHNPDVPDDFMDHRGYFLSRPEQTLFHELGHSFDEKKGLLSSRNKWLSLSGWSPKYKPGLKRMIIQEKGLPEKRGEWFYDPRSKFTRFYAKMNPWDDFADSFSFFIGGLKEIVPLNKRKYLDDLLKKYYYASKGKNI